MENWFVVVMGLVTVFVVLTLIIGLCALLGAILRRFEDKPTEKSPEPEATEEIPNRPELVAAVSAAIAEMSGTDASAIRVLSIKKI